MSIYYHYSLNQIEKEEIYIQQEKEKLIKDKGEYMNLNSELKKSKFSI